MADGTLLYINVGACEQIPFVRRDWNLCRDLFLESRMKRHMRQLPFERYGCGRGGDRRHSNRKIEIYARNEEKHRNCDSEYKSPDPDLLLPSNELAAQAGRLSTPRISECCEYDPHHLANH
jgi:hypothetical protein